jgi:arylsulfatase
MYHTKSGTTLLRTMVILTLVFAASFASAQAKKPNILVIMGDDIGWYNTSI